MTSLTERHEDEQLVKGQRLLEAGQTWDALMAANEALMPNPTRPEALFLAAMALYRGGAKGAALPIFNAAAQLMPHWNTWNSIGCCLEERHPKDAYAAFRKAHETDPTVAAPMSNLCSMASNLGRHEEALSWAERAMAIDPTDKNTLNNAALSLLSLGRWKEAWPKYASSMPSKHREERNFTAGRPTPRWRGQKDAKVVIYGEQGIGDEILFWSMLPQAIATGAEIIVETDPRLAGLARRSFPQAKVYDTRFEPRCVWPADEKPTARLEIGGLGELFGNAPFRSHAYLTACPDKRTMAKAWLDKVCRPGALRVGVAWTGGGWHTGRAERSLLLDQLLPVLSAPNADFVCLEYDDPTRELAELKSKAPEIEIRDLRSFVKKMADYDDTAALVAELDLVIAVTTSVVDLAGALGKPCWVLVNKACPWRYSEAAGDDRMWFYESVTTYRQKQEDHWGAPIAKVARDLRARALAGKTAAAA